MEQVESVDVLIVGSGPAGTSTALHLLQHDPSWSGRLIMIDKAVHPREKLCGGGITHMGQNVLARLGLTLGVPYMPINTATVAYENLSYSFQGNPVFVVVRRDEFDHWLVKEVENRGVQLSQGEGLLDIHVADKYVEAITDKRRIQAKAVVAADGSKSLVRRKLKWPDESRVARLLEILTPEDETDEGFRQKHAVFDFSSMPSGLQGYYWDFPSRVKGKAVMNRGVFDSRSRPERSKIDLVGNLRDSLSLRDRDLKDYQLKGHPIRWFDKDGRYSIPRVILAGDSAGADPLAGEGISFALSYGQVAADALVEAFKSDDFSFSDYRDQILNHSVLKQLPTRTRLARLAYRLKWPWLFRLGWRGARILIRYTRWSDPGYNPLITPNPSETVHLDLNAASQD